MSQASSLPSWANGRRRMFVREVGVLGAGLALGTERREGGREEGKKGKPRITWGAAICVFCRGQCPARIPDPLPQVLFVYFPRVHGAGLGRGGESEGSNKLSLSVCVCVAGERKEEKEGGGKDREGETHNDTMTTQAEREAQGPLEGQALPPCPQRGALLALEVPLRPWGQDRCGWKLRLLPEFS